MDKSLDDMIKEIKSSRGGARGGRGGSASRGARGGRGGASRGAASTSRSSIGRGMRSDALAPVQSRVRKATATQTGRRGGDLRGTLNADARGASRAAITTHETVYKIRVNNLHYDVSLQDVQQLFSQVGTPTKVFMHYDNAGRSLGVADIYYASRAEAQRAMHEYKGATLDGQTIQLTLEETTQPVSRVVRTAPARVATPRALSTIRGASTAGRGGRGASRGAAVGGRGGRGGRGRGGKRGPPPNQADLDAELDNYVKMHK